MVAVIDQLPKLWHRLGPFDNLNVQMLGRKEENHNVRMTFSYGLTWRRL